MKTKVFEPDEWAAMPLWLRITILWALLFPLALVLFVVALPFAGPIVMGKLVWEDTQKEIAREQKKQEVQPCAA